MKLLVAAAFDPELVRFRELARTGAPVELETATLGVGLVDAAIGMTRCIARHAPTHALLLGTCGGIRVATHEVVAGSVARLAVEAHAEAPPPMRLEEELDPALHDALVAAGAKSVQIANTVGITVKDAIAIDGDVEHLEAFAFARACAMHGVRCGVVLGVANAVGASGRGEWRANHVVASARAAEVAWSALERLRAG